MATLVAAGASDTIRGLSDEQLTKYEQRAETAMTMALDRVMGAIAKHLGATRTAAAALVAAGPESVSPDDLAGITPLWSAAVEQDLLPVVAEVYQDAAGTVHADLVDLARLPELPAVTSLASEAYLAQAANTFQEVGSDLWETARGELLDGFQAGEGIPELRERLRASAGLTGRTATLVARTQVLDASNAGSYDTARVSGLDLLKGWEATPDARTRPSHMAAGTFYQGDGMIALTDPFTVGGFSCERPHDPSLPPAQRYRCRCTLIYAMAPVVPTPPEAQLTDLEARHRATLARLEAQHRQRLAEAEARHAQRLAGLEGDDAAALAARAVHERKLTKIAAVHEERLAILEADYARRVSAIHPARRGPLPSAVAPEPPTVPSVGGPTLVPVRASLMQATTVPEVQAAFVREWAAIHRQHNLFGFHPTPVARFVRDGDVQTAREHAEGLLRAIDRFPRVGLAVSHRSIPHYAQADLGTRTVQFGNGFARDRATYLASLREAGTRNAQGIAWHPMTISSPQGVALHEFGHILHHMLSPLELDPTVGLFPPVFRFSTKIDDAVKAVVRDLAAERGIPADELIRREIGEYAAAAIPGGKPTHELIGEAFADAMVNGDAASVLSRRIFRVLVDEYDRTVAGRPGIGRTPGVPSVPLPSTARPAPPSPVPVRESLRRARTIPGIQAALVREWRAATQGLPDEAIPHIAPSSVRLHGDLDTAREHAEGLLRGIERFPAIRVRIDRMVSSRAYAHGGRVIEFSDTWTSDRQGYLTSLAATGRRDAQGISWHPPSVSSPQGIALHEYGHALVAHTYRLRAASPVSLGPSVYDRVREVVRIRAAELGVPDVDLIKQEISEYAAKNTEELIGEAFADAMVNGDAASVLSRRIFRVLVDEYDRTVAGRPGVPGPPTGILPSAPKPVADGLDVLDLTALRALGREAAIPNAARLGRIRLTAELRQVLGRTIAETLQRIDAGMDLPAIVEALAADPLLRDVLAAARRAKDPQRLAVSLRGLATRRGLALPTPAQLRTLQAAERKAAAAAKREAALAVRAEKARLAEVKRQVKAVEAGDFTSLTQTETQPFGGVYTDPAGTRWLVETFTSETDARERALYAALHDLATRDAADPPLSFVVGRGAPGMKGWQVAYPDRATPPVGLGTSDWLAVSLAQIQTVTPAKIKALVAKAGLAPDLAEQLILARTAAVAQARVLARKLPSRNAPLLSDPAALARATFAQQAKWIDGPYGTAGLRAKVTDFTARNVPVQPGYQPVAFEGKIMLRGRQVGSFSRDYYYDYSTGELVAHHAYLEIAPTIQGSGFAEQFNANLIDWYRRSGIKQVRLSANIDVGGYAWARAGYEFADQSGANDVIGRLTALVGDLVKRQPSAGTWGVLADRLRGLDASEIQAQVRAAQALLARARQHPKFDDPLHPSAYEFSQLGRHTGQGKDDMWIGKAAMLGSYWSAVLYLP